jgi:hypothetical protein
MILNCGRSSEKFNFLNNVTTHVLVLFTIISCLFIYYIGPITSGAFNGEFTNIINEQLNPEKIAKLDSNKLLKTYLATLDKDQLKAHINTLNNTDDPLAETINTSIKEKICIIIFSLLLLTLFCNIIPPLFFNNCAGSKHMIIELICVFLMIGGIEYWFFNNVASKFAPVMPSFMESYISQAMVNKVLG